jgi:hypothetical protein
VGDVAEELAVYDAGPFLVLERVGGHVPSRPAATRLSALRSMKASV